MNKRKAFKGQKFESGNGRIDFFIDIIKFIKGFVLFQLTELICSIT